MSRNGRRQLREAVRNESGRRERGRQRHERDLDNRNVLQSDVEDKEAG
jgi:hypothetical protein